MTDPASTPGILLKRGTVCTSAAFAVADVRIEGAAIVAVASDLEPRATERVIDCAGAFVLPGLCNAHTHAQSMLTRGILDIGRLEVLNNNGLAQSFGRTPEETYAGALLNAVEMVRTGATSCCDQFVTLPTPSLEDIGAVVAAYADVGVRATIAPVVGDLSLWNGLPGLRQRLPPRRAAKVNNPVVRETDFQVLDDAIARWDRSADGRIRIALSPSIPYLCSDWLLSELAALADARGVMVYTHVAESWTQTWASMARSGERIVGRLERLGLLNPRTSLAHCVWLTDDDLDRVAAADAVIAHNPASNLRLGNGIAPVRNMLERGIAVGLGTDGSTGSDNQNMFEAMRFAALVSRLDPADDRWLSAADAFDLATLPASRHLGEERVVGRLEAGALADVIVVSRASTYLAPDNDPLTQLALAETGHGVMTVIVDGRIVVEDGEVRTVDEARAVALAVDAARSLRERNARLWQEAGEVEPIVRAYCLERERERPAVGGGRPR